MPYPSLTFAQLLDNATRQELEQFVSLLQGYLSVQHKEDGTHSAITADSVTTTGAITGGAKGTFVGDVLALYGSGKECALGILSTVNGTSLLPAEATRWGNLLGGVTGHFIEHRSAQTPFLSGNELAIWNLGFSTTKPIVRFGSLGGVMTMIDGGAGATLVLGDSTEPLLDIVATAVHATTGTQGTAVHTGSVLETGILTPAQLTANFNDYNPTGLDTARHVRMSSDASRTITGIVAQPSGTLLTLYNAGTNDIVLTNADVTSSAGNRFRCPGNATFTLNGGDAVTLWYDTGSAVWSLLAF